MCYFAPHQAAGSTPHRHCQHLRHRCQRPRRHHTPSPLPPAPSHRHPFAPAPPPPSPLLPPVPLPPPTPTPPPPTASTGLATRSLVSSTTCSLDTTATALPCCTHLPQIVRPRLVQRAQRRLRFRAARVGSSSPRTRLHECARLGGGVPAPCAHPGVPCRVAAGREESCARRRCRREERASVINASLLSFCNKRGDRHVEAIGSMVATNLEGGGGHAPRCTRASAGESCRRSVLLFFESFLFARILDCAAARLRIASMKARTRPSASQAVCSPCKSVAGRFLRVVPFQYTAGFAGSGAASPRGPRRPSAALPTKS